MNTCFVTRIIYDVLIILPLTVFMVVISQIHWASIAIVGVILLSANLCTCCFCVWDGYKFLDKYETDTQEDEEMIEKPKPKP